MAANTTALEGYHEVAKLSDLRSSVRMRVTVEERVIALFYSEGHVYALDHFCYHAGGPLALGDIEDSHGRGMCVICPWHKHKITLDTGESLYTAVDPRNPRNLTPNCTKGRKQRTHHVLVREDTIYIKPSASTTTPTNELESDRYYSEEYKVFMENALKDPTPASEHAVKVPIHSFRVPSSK